MQSLLDGVADLIQDNVKKCKAMILNDIRNKVVIGEFTQGQADVIINIITHHIDSVLGARSPIPLTPPTLNGIQFPDQAKVTYTRLYNGDIEVPVIVDKYTSNSFAFYCEYKGIWMEFEEIVRKYRHRFITKSICFPTYVINKNKKSEFIDELESYIKSRFLFLYPRNDEEKSIGKRGVYLRDMYRTVKKKRELKELYDSKRPDLHEDDIGMWSVVEFLD